MISLAAGAAEIDPGKLPPPSTAMVEFARDIQPILEKSCVRCHGPEKPKSRFRLDARDAALKGGAKGVDILPGQSARSPLIHYVAGLVPEMEMPPTGKGEPLTRDQVALLRSWIDQGVEWPANKGDESRGSFSVTPAAGFVSVSGNRQKFREMGWLRDGASGGVAEFTLAQRLNADTKFTAEGRAFLERQDFKIKMSLEKTDVGFARAGFEHWRRYSDDNGGYDRAITPSSFRLGRDLHLDLGRAWMEFGLTLPDWPRAVLGYEYQFKDGEKSTLQWGPVGLLPAQTPGTDVANIFPAFKEISERVHILKLDLTHDLAGWTWEDNFRSEFTDLKTSRDNVIVHTFGATPDTLVRFRDRHDEWQVANTFRIEKQLRDWLFISGGHLYTHTDAEVAFTEATLTGTGAPTFGDQSFGGPLVLTRDAHVLSASALLGPWAGLSFSGVVQSEWTRQEGAGNGDFQFGHPGVPFFIPDPVTLTGNLDRTSVGEQFGLRYTGLPHTTLYAEGRFQQEHQRQFEQRFDQLVGTGEPFLHDTDSTRDVKEYRAGFHTSPWERWSFSTQLKHREKQSRYDHLTVMPIPGHAYPAFIRAQDILTDQLEARATWRAANWIKTSLAYRIEATDFHTTTGPAASGGNPVGASPGGSIFAGNYDAHTLSLNATAMPTPRLQLATTLSYSDTRTATAQNGFAALPPFRGGVYSALPSGSFALDDVTDLRVSYAFSRGDYGQANVATGLPAGADFTHHALQAGLTRRFKKDINVGLQYFFARYNEPSSGGINDYTAHGIFATLTVRWP